MALMPQNFLRLRRAERGFAFGNELHCPKSATLTVAIIPVTPQERSPPRGALFPRHLPPSTDAYLYYGSARASHHPREVPLAEQEHRQTDSSNRTHPCDPHDVLSRRSAFAYTHEGVIASAHK